MTTKISYTSYNVETNTHQGTFPNTYWESEQIPLYECEEVKAAIRLYPVGDGKESRGNVGLFVWFYGKPQAFTLEVDNMEIKLTGNEEVVHSEKVEKRMGDKQVGRGWSDFCSTNTILGKDVQIDCSITIKLISETDGKRITTWPYGARLYELKNK